MIAPKRRESEFPPTKIGNRSSLLQKIGNRSSLLQKRRESEFPPTEDRESEFPPTEDRESEFPPTEIRCRDREIAPTEPQITFGLAFFRLR